MPKVTMTVTAQVRILVALRDAGDVLAISRIERRPTIRFLYPYARAWRSCRAGEGFADYSRD